MSKEKTLRYCCRFYKCTIFSEVLSEDKMIILINVLINYCPLFICKLTFNFNCRHYVNIKNFICLYTSRYGLR